MIPVLYAVAMGVDALAALVLGSLFDRKGVPVLIFATVVSAFFAPLVFLAGGFGAFLGMALWGLGMGAQESIMRAVIAEMIPAGRYAPLPTEFSMLLSACVGFSGAFSWVFSTISQCPL